MNSCSNKKYTTSSSSPQSFPGMSQQYGVPVGSSVNVMSGPGGAGGSMPGSGGGGHTGPGTYSGPNMQYHQGETSAGGLTVTADCRLNINILYIYCIIYIYICVVTQTRDEEVNFIYITLNY